MRKIFKILLFIILTIFETFSSSFVQAELYSTSISAEVIPSFTFSMPKSTTISFNQDNTFIGYIYAKNLTLPDGYALLVDISHNTFKHDLNQSIEIPYECNYSQVLLKSEKDMYPLHIKIEPDYWKAATSGHYTSTITFTLTIIKT